MKLKPGVFWPPFLLIALVEVLSLWDPQGFASTVRTLNNAIFAHFGPLFCYGTFAVFLTCIAVFFSPLGARKLGGPQAQPLLNYWRWFAVTICTTIAIGIVFWATAEPIYHWTSPPKSLGIAPNSPEAAAFAMSTLFLHWTILPYAIYTLPALLFAFAYYNMRRPFTLGSCLYPLLKLKPGSGGERALDVVCLYALSLGMATSLATGILSLGGGLSSMGLPKTNWTNTGLTIAVVLTFIISSISGLQKGIRVLSDLNMKMFLALVVFFVCFGPLTSVAHLTLEGLGLHLSTFVETSLLWNFQKEDSWPQAWTIFYWANWLAWAPITAVFLGRIGYGYTIRTFIVMNLFVPALFCGLWMAVFGGTALQMATEGGLNLAQVLNTQGPEELLYFVIRQFPFSDWIVPVFLVTAFLSYVTSADSNTTAMAGMSCHGIAPESPESPVGIKIAWGLAIGGLALLILGTSGIDGIKNVSTLGGLPALLFECAVIAAAWTIAWNPAKFDVFDPAYDPQAKTWVSEVSQQFKDAARTLVRPDREKQPS